MGTILFKNRRALFSWVWDPDLNFGEAYMFGAVEIRGDLVPVLEHIYRALGTATPRSWWLWQRSNDVQAARENVHQHYDLGNEFYRLWLDREMVYTCAYFPEPDCALEEAQIAKMDLVCRKLGLKAGRTGDRSGMRVGIARAVHGPGVRRDGARVQYLGRADCLRARSGQSGAAPRSRRVRRGRLSRGPWRV